MTARPYTAPQLAERWPRGLRRAEADESQKTCYNPVMQTLIYCATSPSGKQYIGLTRQTLPRRWVQHVCNARPEVGSSLPLHVAIRKYGRKGFVIELLETCPDLEAAQEAEKRWIAKRNTVAPLGYNVSLGGKAGDGLAGVASREARRKADPAFDAHFRNSRKKSAATIQARRAQDPTFNAEFLAHMSRIASLGAIVIARRRSEDGEYEKRYRATRRATMVAARVASAQKLADPVHRENWLRAISKASKATAAAIRDDPQRSAAKSARIKAKLALIENDLNRDAQRSARHRAAWTAERRLAQRDRALKWNAKRWERVRADAAQG